MKTIIGVDKDNLVRLISSAPDSSYMPKDWNGLKLTAYELIDEQQVAFDSLPQDRGGTTFNGTSFNAIPAQPVVLVKRPTVDDVIAILQKKQYITEADVSTQVDKIAKGKK